MEEFVHLEHKYKEDSKHTGEEQQVFAAYMSIDRLSSS